MTWFLSLKPLTYASHQGLETHAQEMAEATGPGHPIPGAPFQVYLAQGTDGGEASKPSRTEVDAAVQTVVDAFTHMMQHRNEYQRFNEALTRAVLEKVIIEPKVVNREGKEFSFLVARTKQKGRVNLLISAAALVENGYLHHPESLVPLLAREFQWVVSKADTAPKPKAILIERDLENAPIQTNNKAILEMSADERDAILQQLFETYLTTVDDFKSLENQPFYDVGTTTLIQPTHPDSTIKLYDIRVREALQKIVRDPYFNQHTPRAVKSLLNGTIWNVSFVNIVERDWSTRTRVQPKDKAVSVGETGQIIQPAKILLNVYRTAAPEDPFYAETDGLRWARYRRTNWHVSSPGRFKRTSLKNPREVMLLRTK